MRICRLMLDAKAQYCLIEGDTARVIDGSPFDRYRVTDRMVKLDGTEFLSPCEPMKIVAVGLNYAEHANEMSETAKDYPVIFMKPASSIIGHKSAIIRPRQSERVDYEAELAIVIKKRCKNVSKGDAMEYVLGFTCLNDVTARDLQSLDKQWTRAKSFDTFCPLGPWVETEFDWRDAKVELRLNGEVKQSGRTSQMINACDELVSFISSVMTLEAGDVIATGTPSGIGPMQKGDSVIVEVEGIGELVNTVE